jgi:hypothetical protein
MVTSSRTAGRSVREGGFAMEQRQNFAAEKSCAFVAGSRERQDQRRTASWFEASAAASGRHVGFRVGQQRARVRTQRRAAFVRAVWQPRAGKRAAYRGPPAMRRVYFGIPPDRLPPKPKRRSLF